MESVHQNNELEEKGYHSFLLRLWPVDVKKTRAWRFSLEDTVTGERKGFANIAELMSFLMADICNDQHTDTK